MCLLNAQDHSIQKLKKFIAGCGIFFVWIFVTYFDFCQLVSRFNERFVTVPGVILPGMKKFRCIGDSNFAKFKQDGVGLDFDSVWALCICLQFGLARLSQLSSIRSNIDHF